MRRPPVFALILVLATLVAGCASLSSTPADDAAPWKDDASKETITAAPDAGGPLSFRNCPTLAEAQAAVPAIRFGPDANAVPYKTMELQCSYGLPGLDVQLRSNGISFLVFESAPEGVHMWDSARSDPSFGPASDIAGLGDAAFATVNGDYTEIWVVAGAWGFHTGGAGGDGVTLERLVAFSRAMLASLARPPR